VAAMRARSASISASGAIGIVNGRIVVADIWGLLLPWVWL
jgi:hypothetical protein